MKLLLITLTLSLASLSANAEAQYFINNKEVTKREALMSLIKQPEVKVLKCNEQELSKKATIVNK